MTVPEILLAIDHPLGRHGRTTCPIHHGDNPSAFWFSDTGWCCFTRCGSGGVRDLSRHLGHSTATIPAPPYVIEGLEGVTPDLLRPRARVTDHLTRAVHRLWADRDDQACFAHRRALRLQAQLEATLTLGRDHPGLREALEPLCGQIWGESRTAFDQAHRVWGGWPWPCGCYEGTAEPVPVDWGMLQAQAASAARFAESLALYLQGTS